MKEDFPCECGHSFKKHYIELITDTVHKFPWTSDYCRSCHKKNRWHTFKPDNLRYLENKTMLAK